MNDTETRNGELCPACGEGHLSSRVNSSPVEYNGHTKDLPLHYSVCDYCGSELAGAAEAKLNKRAMAAFRKEVDSLLSGEEIRRFRNDYGLSQELCAELFGGGVVAFSRYEKDDIIQSCAMDRLLKLCITEPQNIILLAKEAGITLTMRTLESINAVANEKFKEMISDALADMESGTPEWSAPDTSANDNIFELYAASSQSCPEEPDQWAVELPIAA